MWRVIVHNRHATFSHWEDAVDYAQLCLVRLKRKHPQLKMLVSDYQNDLDLACNNIRRARRKGKPRTNIQHYLHLSFELSLIIRIERC